MHPTFCFGNLLVMCGYRFNTIVKFYTKTKKQAAKACCQSDIFIHALHIVTVRAKIIAELSSFSRWLDGHFNVNEPLHSQFH